MKNKKDIIKANGHDIANYIARYGLANFQIQAVMKLDGHLDFDRLVKAVRLSVDAQPVLGCHFVKCDPPYWKRFANLDQVRFCSLEETDHPEEAVQRFLESHLDMEKDPVLLVKLIRSGEYDTLGLKINHACSDAAGAREYIRLLTDIYSSIGQREVSFTPNPGIRNKYDHIRLIKALGKDSPEKTWGPMEQITFPAWRFPWKSARKGGTGFAVCRLPSGQLDIMNRYRKARGATINDLILTAIFRAMFEISSPPYGVPMDIPITIDLRKYLPDQKTEAIRNLSGGVVIRVARKKDEPFDGTLSRIMALTKDMKKKQPSIKGLQMVDYIEKLSFHQICAFFTALSQMIEFVSHNPFCMINTCSPVLSNFGFISDSPIEFGERKVIDAYIIPPVVRAPGMLLVASTYNGVITLAVGYYKPSARKEDMEGLLNKIRDELVEGCKL